jgi:tetratricopeptide (TPR) repeat protein
MSPQISFGTIRKSTNGVRALLSEGVVVPTPTRIQIRVDALLSANRVVEANDLAELALRAFPTHLHLLQSVVIASLRMPGLSLPDRLTTAYSAVDRLAGANPTSIQYWGSLARVLAFEIQNSVDPSRARQRFFESAEDALTPAAKAASMAISLLIDDGLVRDAEEFAFECFERWPINEFGWPLITATTATGNFSAAESTRKALISNSRWAARGVAVNRAKSWARRGLALEALAEMAALKPRCDPTQTEVMIQAWTLLGTPQLILDHLDQTDSGLSPSAELLHRVEAHWRLGDAAAATSLFRELIDLNQFQPSLTEKALAILGPDATNDLLRALISSGDAAAGALSRPDAPAVKQRSSAYWHLEEPGRALDVIDYAIALDVPIDPAGRYLRAQCLYALRQFDAARDQCAAITSGSHTWLANKLTARTLLEQGEFVAAEMNRRRHGRPNDDFDEVLYHALLGQQRVDEAFALHPLPQDLRQLRSVFPTSAEAAPTTRAAHRFVIADAGPGDEIQDATAYAELLRRSDRLTISCDPRLRTLLERSFPEIEFVACERPLGAFRFASNSPQAGPRAPNALARFLSAAAFQVAASADSVVLGRAVKTAYWNNGSTARTDAHIVPEPSKVSQWRSALSGPVPTVGIAWRSEVHNSWRNIHYLQVDDLAHLLREDVTFVCLQHDATPDERSFLDAAAKHPVRYIDEIDARNDFEELAALTAAIDLVTGVGTTIVNLAAAVGTQTVMMQPSHFSTWLAKKSGGTNFWYGSCDVIYADPPWDIDHLVQLATAAIASRLGLSRSGSEATPRMVPV